MNNNVCLVLPTIRENCLKDFVDRWSGKDGGLFRYVDTIVMEDNPTSTFEVPRGLNIDHLSWVDIKNRLNKNEWIIPRRSDTVRSFAYLEAYRRGYDYILTLDDDCYPPSKEDGLEYSPEMLVKLHLKNLNERSRWYNTLNSVKPRGIPFYNVGESSSIVLNHGLWTNVLDYDAPYQLANPIPEDFAFDNRIIPSGLYFPMCGMNVMWNANYTVLMYHLLMGRRVAMLPEMSSTDADGLLKLPFDRFGDIWCGILMKKVVDHLRLQVSTGMPYIRHERASDPFTNLRKEANGIAVNEVFWQFVDMIDLVGLTNPIDCYEKLGKSMVTFSEQFSKFKEFEDYFRLLGKSMIVWCEEIRKAQTDRLYGFSGDMQVTTQEKK